MVFDSGSHKSRHSTVGIVVSPSENLQPLPVAIEENIQTTAEFASFISRTICGFHHKGVIVPSVTIDGLRAYQKVLQPGNDNEHVSFLLLKAGINITQIVAEIIQITSNLRKLVKFLRLRKNKKIHGARCPDLEETRWVYIGRVIDFIEKQKEQILKQKILSVTAFAIQQYRVLSLLILPLQKLVAQFEKNNMTFEFAFPLIQQAFMNYDQLDSNE
ncbi:MAG: hypothetical protein EZS28_000373 [Streblomastix strix]|uniref:Uncharacterized protein n=1 Tax=Streblomastix strix TaxID=222440 RepID=A0A5J4XBA9_9EUKA|nr:MAG: hypothetical protein EZS28_000373 [Streblomastix strix]